MHQRPGQVSSMCRFAPVSALSAKKSFLLFLNHPKILGRLLWPLFLLWFVRVLVRQRRPQMFIISSRKSVIGFVNSSSIVFSPFQVFPIHRRSLLFFVQSKTKIKCQTGTLCCLFLFALPAECRKGTLVYLENPDRIQAPDKSQHEVRRQPPVCQVRF